jgi:hypothetical protein
VSEASIIEEQAAEPESFDSQSEVESYTRLELCDQCSVAQAFYRVEFESGFLFLCRHHFMQNETKLFETAIDVVDESDLL